MLGPTIAAVATVLAAIITMIGEITKKGVNQNARRRPYLIGLSVVALGLGVIALMLSVPRELFGERRPANGRTPNAAPTDEIVTSMWNYALPNPGPADRPLRPMCSVWAEVGPSKERQDAQRVAEVTVKDREPGTITFPVRKGEFWRIILGGPEPADELKEQTYVTPVRKWRATGRDGS